MHVTLLTFFVAGGFLWMLHDRWERFKQTQDNLNKFSELTENYSQIDINHPPTPPDCDNR